MASQDECVARLIQIDAQTPIAITLSAEQWNGVLFVMGEAPVPYKLTAPLIQGIGQQMQTAAAAAQPAAIPNGHADIARHIGGAP